MAISGDPPPEPPTDKNTARQRTRRPYRGGIVALVAGVGMAFMAFLPWLSSPLGNDLSGWNLYDAAREAGENPLCTGEFFGDRFSPFLTGLTGIISGVLMAGAAFIVLLAPKIPQPAKATVPNAWAIPAMLMAFIATMASFVGFYTLLIAQPAPRLIDPGFGLILWLFIAVTGFTALIIACGGTAARKTRS